MKETLHLAELVRIVKNNGDDSTRNLFRKKGHQTRERRFVRSFIRLGLARASEADIAKEVFGNDTTERDTDYVVLRSQVKKRLLSMMGHLDLKRGSPRQQALYNTARALFRARVLLMLGARRTALQLIPKALKEANDFGFTQRAVECLEVLCDNAALTGNRTAFLKYDRELSALIKRGEAEREANRIVNLVALEFANRALGLPGASERLRGSADRCLAIFMEYPSYDTGLAYYRMEIGAREQEHDHLGAIACAEEAMRFFLSYPVHLSPSVLGEFSLLRLVSCFHASRIEDGFEAARQCEKIFLAESNNWFQFKSFEFLLHMHALNFEAAHALFERVKSSPRYYAQPDSTLERWQLFDRYLRVAEGETQTMPQRRAREQTAAELFRDFARDVPIYTRDKAGFNIALLILHVYVLLATNRREEITMRTEVMPRYLQRHLKTRQTGPTAGFLKTLIYLERCSFDLKEFMPRGQKYLDQFLAPTTTTELEDCQALPYPFIWNLFVELLAR